jgi:hypothetical protein
MIQSSQRLGRSAESADLAAAVVAIAEQANVVAADTIYAAAAPRLLRSTCGAATLRARLFLGFATPSFSPKWRLAAGACAAADGGNSWVV